MSGETISGIEITLSSEGMGDDATEDDFERWVAYVAKRLPQYDVKAGRFGVSGGDRIRDRDGMAILTDDIRDEILSFGPMVR